MFAPVECRDVLAAVTVGDESPAVLEHLAGCEACRSKSEGTAFLEDRDVATERRPPAFVRARRLPWVIAAALVPVVVLLAVAAVKRARVAPAVAPTASPAPSAPAAPAPPPAPVVVPLPAPAPVEEAAAKGVGRRAKPLPKAPPVEGERANTVEPPAKEEAAPEPEAPAEEERPAAAVAGGGLGWLTITSEPWARVVLDGKDTGRTTPARLTAPAGRHRVELRAASGRSVTVEVTVKPRDTVEIDRVIE
jgi:hypothetical protein